MLGSSDVVVSTIQRLYSVLRGNDDTEGDDPKLDEYAPDAPVIVTYSKGLPPETFDLVIIDEAHRSIYGSGAGCSSTSTSTSSA
jgi:type I restriction enzyme R subunit